MSNAKQPAILHFRQHAETYRVSAFDKVVYVERQPGGDHPSYGWNTPYSSADHPVFDGQTWDFDALATLISVYKDELKVLPVASLDVVESYQGYMINVYQSEDGFYVELWDRKRAHVSVDCSPTWETPAQAIKFYRGFIDAQRAERRQRRTQQQVTEVEDYSRSMPLEDVTFTCGLCAQTVTEPAYPGATPSICATCLEKYPSRNAARVALWRKNNPAAYEVQKQQQKANRAARKALR